MPTPHYHSANCDCGTCNTDPDGDPRRLCNIEDYRFPCGCRHDDEQWLLCATHSNERFLATYGHQIIYR